jgi:hypothetical protein
MEFYSAMKKNEIVSFAGKWMEQENIILSEGRCRRPKVTCFLSYVNIVLIQIQQFYEKQVMLRGPSHTRL